MVIIDGDFGGIDIKVIKYGSKNDLQGEFLDDSDRIKKEMGLEDNIYVNKGGRVEPTLGSYGPSKVFLSYMCEVNGTIQNATIMTASVEHGREAMTLIEHFLYSNGTIVGTALHRHRSLEDIDYVLHESDDIERILSVSIGSQFRSSTTKERYGIFVAEKNDQNTLVIMNFQRNHFYKHLFIMFISHQNCI